MGLSHRHVGHQGRGGKREKHEPTWCGARGATPGDGLHVRITEETEETCGARQEWIGARHPSPPFDMSAVSSHLRWIHRPRLSHANRSLDGETYLARGKTMERKNRSCKSQAGCVVIGNVHASMAKRDGRGTRALGKIHEGKRQHLLDEWIST